MRGWRTKDVVLGVNRLFLWAAFALATCIAALIAAAPAAARPIALAELSCATGADTVEAAFGIDAAELDCSTGRFDRRERFVRARTDLSDAGILPPGRLIWQTDPTSFASMLIRLDYADGSQRLIDVDAQMAVRNWDANGNFWVPIQQQSSALTAIDVVVERPQSDAMFHRMILSGFEEASSRNFSRTLLYVLICGTLLVPIIYDLLFFRVFRARFMIWHLLMTACTLGYVLMNSGLILVVYPDISSHLRYAAIYIAMSGAILGLSGFTVQVLEEGTVSRRSGNALTWLAAINLAISLLSLFDIEALRMRIVDLYLLSVLPLAAALVTVLVTGLRRRSRAAIFLAAAYAGLIVSGVAQVVASLGSFYMAELIDDSIYVALVILVLGTSAAVGDRFLVLKAERDRAHMTVRKLGAMANRDGLTGLLNRRAFDQHRRLVTGSALLLLDIDRFKSINDTYGHQRGDAALCQTARVIEDVMSLRREGEIYRLGGEEFAVICEVADEAEARALSEALRSTMERSGEREDGFDIPDFTISIGAVMGAGQLMHVAFSEADAALYQAKNNGRNRCEFARSGLSYA